MIDFAKMQREMYERATPEERARIDSYHEREARYNATRRAISADFARMGEKNKFDFVKKKSVYETFVEREWTTDIEMRIEDRVSFDGHQYEIIRFIGGSTGHESYRLGDDFVAALREDLPEGDPDVLTICGGSASYDRCRVSCSAVLEYLSEVRPELVPPPAVVETKAEPPRLPWLK